MALEDAEVKYSTVQNWFPGDEEGRGGIYNFVTKRADCREARAKVMWTQVETGSAITWKYPSCILRGEGQPGRVLLDRHRQQPPAGRHRHQDAPPGQEHPQPDRLEGDQRRVRAEHLSRAGVDASQGHRQPQLHPVRQPADRLDLRRAHGALYRVQEQLEPGGARGDDVEGGRGPAFLLPPARHGPGGGGGAGGERLLPRGAAGAADGVRHGGAEAGGDQPGGSVG